MSEGGSEVGWHGKDWEEGNKMTQEEVSQHKAPHWLPEIGLGKMRCME